MTIPTDIHRPCPHRRRQARRWALTALVAIVSPGCLGPTCDRSGDDRAAVAYLQGTTSSEASFYQSSPSVGPYLHFPPGETFRLYHQLAGAPQSFNAYLSFAECPMPDPNHECSNSDRSVGDTSEAAGNEVVFENITAEYIQVRNDTCADFYLRVTASYVPLTLPALDGGSDALALADSGDASTADAN